MATDKLSREVGSVGNSIESKFNQLLIGMRARQMPKSLKRVHKSLTRGRSSHYADARLSARQSEVHDGVTMSCEYLGSTLIEEQTFEAGANYLNTGVSVMALQRILRMCRKANILKCYLAITRRAFIASKHRERITILNIPIEGVLFVCVDVKYKKIAIVIARNEDTQRVECMAFLCESVKKASSMCNAMFKSYNEFDSTLQQSESTNASELREEYTSVGGTSRLNQATANGDVEIHITKPPSSSSPRTQRDSGYLSHLPTEHAAAKPPRDDLGNLDLAQPAASFNQSGFSYDRPSSKHSQSVDDLLFDVMRDREPEPVPKVEATHQPNDFTTVSTVADFSKARRDDDMELEFSSFARSRSQADLTDLKPMVTTGWNI